MEEILESLHQRLPFACHMTTMNRGRTLKNPGARYCVGAMRYTLAREEPGLHMLLAESMQLWSVAELNTRAPIFESEEDLLAHHGETFLCPEGEG